jgi:hypothetical protein
MKIQKKKNKQKNFKIKFKSKNQIYLETIQNLKNKHIMIFKINKLKAKRNKLEKIYMIRKNKWMTQTK